MKPGSVYLAVAVATLAAGCVSGDKRPGDDVVDVCTKGGERECIARTEGLASRDGDSLRLTLKGGKILVLTGTPGGCGGGRDCLDHRLAGYRPADDLFVVERETRFGTKRTLIDRKTGDALDATEASKRG